MLSTSRRTKGRVLVMLGGLFVMLCALMFCYRDYVLLRASRFVASTSACTVFFA
jgi:hypothetical protein